MHTAQIVRALRRASNADQLVSDDAGTLTERIVSRAGSAGVREEVLRHLTEVYQTVGGIISLDRELALGAQLDAATARAHWRFLLTLLDRVVRTPTMTQALREQLAEALIAHAAPEMEHSPMEDDPQ